MTESINMTERILMEKEKPEAEWTYTTKKHRSC